MNTPGRPADPYDDPAWAAYAQHVLDELLPKMRDSAVVVSLVPAGPADVKFAVELGFSIMLDKPIIAVVTSGVQIPAKLARVTDAVVEGDLDSDAGRASLRDRLEETLTRLIGGRAP